MVNYILFFPTSSSDHLSVSYRTLRTGIDLLMTSIGVILGEQMDKNQPQINFSSSLVTNVYITID